ncbi:MAG: hypothetical protein K0U41_08685 [Gammaproteobacteria bacterium]|nr:hypothetical protein [Gammaproteobacteria bacterium]
MGSINLNTEAQYLTQDGYKDLKAFRLRKLDINKPLKEQTALLSLEGSPILREGELSFAKAPSKNGKTFGTALLVSQLIKPTRGFKSELKDEDMIIWIDTEQSDNSVALIHRRISYLTGQWERVEFNLQDSNTTSQGKQQEIFAAIRILKPKLIILDNLTDLLEDVDDGPGAQKFMGELLSLARTNETALLSIVHMNESMAKDSNPNMRGKAGREATRKCANVFEVKKEEDQFKVTCTQIRDAAPHPDFYFKIKGEEFKDTDGEIKEISIPCLIGDDDVFRTDKEIANRYITERMFKHVGARAGVLYNLIKHEHKGFKPHAELLSSKGFTDKTFKDGMIYMIKKAFQEEFAEQRFRKLAKKFVEDGIFKTNGKHFVYQPIDPALLEPLEFEDKDLFLTKYEPLNMDDDLPF